MTATIGILLATWNGARYLPAQLQSIAAQTHHDWHLTARDDGSDDGTLSILAAFARAHPGRVTVLRDGLGRLGPLGNFSRLMELAREPYLAFCDQDDVWRSGKLARALGRMRALEAAQAPGAPCLVHADRTVVDGAGREIASSWWASRGIGPADFPIFESHLSFCVAAGSTMLINRPLAELAGPIPATARMHDCWIELVAHAFGAVAWLEEIALDHRRHGRNASGSPRDNSAPAARRPLARATRLLSDLAVQKEVYGLYFAQAAAFRARYGDVLFPELRRNLDLFLSIPDRSLPGRLHAIWSSRAAPPGLARALVLAALAGGAARTGALRGGLGSLSGARVSRIDRNAA